MIFPTGSISSPFEFLPLSWGCYTFNPALKLQETAQTEALSKANSLICSILTQVHPRTRHVVRKIILFICIQTSLNGGPKEIRELYFNTHRQNVIAIVISIF